jgi:hypothetical protein
MGLAAAAGISAVATIGGGLLASSGASKAAKSQSKSDALAIAEQRRQYDLSRGDFKPYMDAGKSALPGIEDLLGINGNPKSLAAIEALKASPAYQSLYNNGQEAVLQNASATGGLRGGNTQRSLADFGRDTLSTVISDQLARLGGLAGIGQGATGSVAGLGANSANQIGGLLQAQGNARASGALAQSGIWSGALNNLGSIAGSLIGGGGFGGSQTLNVPQWSIPNIAAGLAKTGF